MNMNKGFINRNRVYWMNTKGISGDKVIVNEDLFNIPEDITLKDDIAIDIKQSDKPYAIGIISFLSGNSRKYYTYENDEYGKTKWIQVFESFRCALVYAKKAYNYLSSKNKVNYKYEEYSKILKK